MAFSSQSYCWSYLCHWYLHWIIMRNLTFYGTLSDSISCFLPCNHSPLTGLCAARVLPHTLVLFHLQKCHSKCKTLAKILPIKGEALSYKKCGYKFPFYSMALVRQKWLKNEKETEEENIWTIDIIIKSFGDNVLTNGCFVTTFD